VLQSNVKFASLREQALFYGDITDDEDGVQNLRQLVTECKDVFRLKLGAGLSSSSTSESIRG
jgi:hypothetical protein